MSTSNRRGVLTTDLISEGLTKIQKSAGKFAQL